VNVLPLDVDSTVIEPWLACAIWATIASPRPEPGSPYAVLDR
jgi:hypothetical protein